MTPSEEPCLQRQGHLLLENQARSRVPPIQTLKTLSWPLFPGLRPTQTARGTEEIGLKSRSPLPQAPHKRLCEQMGSIPRPKGQHMRPHPEQGWEPGSGAFLGKGSTAFKQLFRRGRSSPRAFAYPQVATRHKERGRASGRGITNLRFSGGNVWLTLQE